MPSKRVTLPANALGPVSRQGDKARIQDRVIKQAQAKAKAASQVKPPSEAVRPKPSYASPMSPAEAQKRMVSMKAPTSAVRPSRAGAAYTPGSTSDLAYTGVRAAPAASKALRPKRLGSGVEGAVLTAGVAAAGALYDKVKKRGSKAKPKKAK